ncbi:sensor domain-containing diguanylate cyclase [Acinetobacter sp. SwsAc4]|uniref:sensor domain-containing diguanylate cyclase n=1 Tax=Acinetobacter sp. SwsAc4 TaxID=2749437 RepID=UPI0015B915EA|nr:sensor domain-containing diguanylate cyclase [Acinetobacter sp. SwsAc4]NWK82941.1 sensor domain-containing diguanylate cyclase [Acinetobacter sp. SwsAc4]
MKVPNIPDYEISRLATLTSLSILDTEEERFNKLTRIAKKTFSVPIALVSLIDENRQWFKSCLGLDFRETSRDISFCGHAILEDKIFVIEDALNDERFFDNPLVINSPNIRFYAGCPLKVLNARIGTLCIIDTAPRKMTDDDLLVLKDLASLVVNELVALQLATIDELTKMPNRRGILNLIQNGVDICKRQKIVSTLVFFDLNQFKSINDTFGHDEGDIALRSFSNLLVEAGREADIFGRLGGDEFVGWLSNCDKDNLVRYVDRLKSKTEEYNLQSKKDYKIDFAYGSVTIEHSMDANIESILKHADKLMYENKKSRGKNHPTTSST